jgi:hypothetical protein
MLAFYFSIPTCFGVQWMIENEKKIAKAELRLEVDRLTYGTDMTKRRDR